MVCHRCRGLMVEEERRDWGEWRGHNGSNLWRCLVCGEVVDLVIIIHRHEMKKARIERQKKPARRETRTIPV